MADIVTEQSIEQQLPKLVKPAEIDKQAEELRKRTELPKKPGQRVQFREMKDWLNLLTPEMEEQVDIYIYRLDPPIIRQKTRLDNPNNIDVISQRTFNGGLKAFEEAYIADTQGGGKYQLLIKNQGYKPKVNADSTGYFEVMVTIPFSLHRPKMVHIDGTGLDLNEVNWDDKNAQSFKAWANAQGYIDKECKVVEIKEKGGTTVNGGVDANTVSMMKMMLDFTTKMSEKEQQNLKKQLGGEDALTKSMGDLMLEKMKQEDPNKQMSTMTTLITAIMGKQEKPVDNTATVVMPMFMTLVTQMMESSKQQFQMMMELFKQSSGNKGEEGTSKIDELRSIIEIAREIKGGGSQEKSVAETLIQTGAEILPSVIGIVGNIMAMQAQARGVKPVEVSPNGSPMERIRQEQNQVAQQPQQVNTPQIAPSEAAQMIASYGPIIMNKLAGDGWEFGAWVADGFGDAIAASLVKHGPDALLVAAKSVPQFWQQVEATYGEAHMKKWLQSLCNYKEIMKQMEEEENGEEIEK
jgi:hypothetical protein